MGEATKIEWAHHTFNPWRGCTHVSPGCEHCYAETLANRFPGTHGTWGAGGTRVVSADAYWRQPLKWDRAAAEAGERHRVFCASLADVFEDRPDLVEPRLRLFSLIADTRNLDWLLLTKRPENALRFFEVAADYMGLALADLVPWPNLWLGTSVEDQRRADERIPHLLACPAAVRFLSCEPLLGPVDLDGRTPVGDPWLPSGLHPSSGFVDWIIVGGESGPGARPMDLAWARSLVAQGRTAGVPVFVKQLGARPMRAHHQPDQGMGARLVKVERDGVFYTLRDRKGGDPEEWPEDLRVREFPASATAS